MQRSIEIGLEIKAREHVLAIIDEFGLEESAYYFKTCSSLIESFADSMTTRAESLKKSV